MDTCLSLDDKISGQSSLIIIYYSQRLIVLENVVDRPRTVL